MINSAAVIQIGIAVFGLSALAMAMGNNALLRKLAPLIGLVGQSFWAVYAYQASAWGIVLLVIAYTGVYLWGMWIQWKP